MSDKDPEPSPPAPDTAASPSALPADPETQSQHQSAESASPAFEPLFTLLTNVTTGATIHPHVQYLFSDDDTSVLSQPSDDPDHRTLVVDLVPSGNTWSIQWASSLNPDFAITSSQLAVQRNDDPDGDSSTMLRLEGVEREPLDLSGGSRPNSLPSSGSGAIGREDVDSLAREFKRRAGVLKKVVGEGEKRRDLIARQGSQDEPEMEMESPGDAESANQVPPAAPPAIGYEDEFPG